MKMNNGCNDRHMEIVSNGGSNRPLNNGGVMNTTTARKWMIVDDNEDLLSLMRLIAGRFTDAQIECFNAPQDALAAFEAAPKEFEFIITDLEMPRMNGFELCRRMREVAPAQKVLLATGSGFVSEETAESNGFCGLLPKPFPFDAFRAVLDTVGISRGCESAILTTVE